MSVKAELAGLTLGTGGCLRIRPRTAAAAGLSSASECPALHFPPCEWLWVPFDIEGYEAIVLRIPDRAEAMPATPRPVRGACRRRVRSRAGSVCGWW